MNTSPVRYFHAENCNRFIRAGGRLFNFIAYAHLGGTWLGTFQTAEPKDHEAIKELLDDPKSAVTEIDEAEYLRCASKKVEGDRRSGTLSLPQTTQAPTQGLIPSAPPVGVPVEPEMTRPEPVIPEGTPLTSPEQVVSIGVVATGLTAASVADSQAPTPVAEPAKVDGVDLA